MDTSTIWKEFSDRLQGFILSKVNNTEVAKDLLQEVFIKIHLRSSSIKDEKKLVSWIYQLTRNTIIDYYRKKKLPLTELEYIEMEDTDLNENFLPCLLPFINSLPENDKSALVETALKGKSQKDYARELGLPYPTIKSRVQRAKKKLKQAFIDCCYVQTDGYGNILSRNDDCNC